MAGPVVGDGFVHTALLYRHEAEFFSDVSRFVQAAVTRGEPVLVAVPGRRVKPLRLTLGAAAGEVRFVDITQAGRNPGRMISVVRAFAEVHLGQRVSVVGEPAWPDRSSPELVEVAIHEALSNLAFAGVPLTALCPYEVAALPPEALERARQTHPLLAWPGRQRANPAYLGPGQLPPPCREPLSEPPAGTDSLRFGNDLQPVRALVRRRATLLSLPSDRAADLVIAVSELAANTVRHTRHTGIVRVWQDSDELVCEVTDQGHITDPLAGRRRPAPDTQGGHGLWLVNEVCDLVELRTGPHGTTVRVHMKLAG